MGRYIKPILKYRNKKTEIDGIMFDSKKEGTRYLDLKLLENLGEIKNLELQPKFEFIINDIKICSYRADFRYKDKDGNEIVEDVKGYKTSMYNLKKKLMLAFHGIVIKES